MKYHSLTEGGFISVTPALSAAAPSPPPFLLLSLGSKSPSSHDDKSTALGYQRSSGGAGESFLAGSLTQESSTVYSQNTLFGELLFK